MYLCQTVTIILLVVPVNCRRMECSDSRSCPPAHSRILQACYTFDVTPGILHVQQFRESQPYREEPVVVNPLFRSVWHFSVSLCYCCRLHCLIACAFLEELPAICLRTVSMQWSLQSSEVCAVDQIEKCYHRIFSK